MPAPPFRHPANWRWRGEARPEASSEAPLALHPCLDGRYLLLGPDSDLNHPDIAMFSKKDALALNPFAY
ncbi:hypothetical protein MUK42_36897 [Musa troglodytarum]|uniref:Uncharacterized protein n=1 Tax=Musa troglodytarum TaxID=320322 RepID=A0A9E7FG45_9LILI|nr:hypothetical protein MUK42_36897 [Musa troglodytarum]